LTATRIAEIELRSRFVVILAILVRTVSLSRAEGAMVIFTINVEVGNLVNSQVIIKRDYDKELEDKGRSLLL
jgi:hypothetical protein